MRFIPPSVASHFLIVAVHFFTSFSQTFPFTMKQVSLMTAKTRSFGSVGGIVNVPIDHID